VDRRVVRRWAWYRLALVTTDVVALGLAFAAAALMRERAAFEVGPYGAVALVAIPGLLAIIWARGAYSQHRLLYGPEEYARVISGCTYGMLLVVVSSYLLATPMISRGWLLMFWLLGVILVCGGRFAVRRTASRLRRRGWFVRRLLVAGVGDQGLAIAEQLHMPVERGLVVVGFVDDYLGVGTPLPRVHASEPFVVLGHARHAHAVAKQYSCDLIIVVPAALSWESQQALARLGTSPAAALEVRLAPTAYDLTAGPVQPAPLFYVPLLRMRLARIVGLEATARTAIDCVLATILLVLGCVPAAFALARARVRGVRPLVVERPILGQGGKPITLRLLSPAVSQHLLIRGMPALWAVLRGEMALVGPRPVPVEDARAIQRWASLILTVKPGLIGPWRLASKLAADQDRVLLDVWWIRNWSLWQHLFVVAQTSLTLLRGARREQSLDRWQVTGSNTADAPVLEMAVE
jgi:Bacterial sugar transferase/CoA-binding domain